MYFDIEPNTSHIPASSSLITIDQLPFLAQKLPGQRKPDDGKEISGKKSYSSEPSSVGIVIEGSLPGEDILSDVLVDHVVPYLLEKFILNYDDKQMIDREITNRQKAERLLDILTCKSKDDFLVFPTFKESLRKHYEWVYNKLCEDVTDRRFSIPTLTLNGNPCKNPSEIGGVPCLPNVNIERRELLSDVVSKISALKQNQYLVVQGMAGCGKSVLATQAVHKLISERGNNDEGKIYWLSIGKECSDSNDVLLGKMRILCDKLDVNRAPKSVEQGREILRDAFMTRSEALLVLDNVWSHRVIRNFDVGCRIMVTTQDMSVMDVVNGRLASCVRVAEGFQESESLNFFCEALNIPAVENLPVEAKMIHAECKGSPMVISLIASLLDDHRTSETNDTSRWTHYYESLSKRKFSGIRRDRSYEHASIFDAICLSFDNLDNKYKLYYQDFGLFQDDVEIPCQVLQTLWSKSKHEAEDIMKTFVRKSMAMEQYDGVQKSYVYYVHDLQLDFLKYRLLLGGSQMEKDLHLKFVQTYETKCNKEFHNLPDDGYIHFHIGYHAFKSGRLDIFPQIYLDLKFIGEKLRLTGPADVLTDFRKYGTYIVDGKEQNQTFLEELETFTQQMGYKMYGHPDIDIIQLAIQLPNLPSLSKQARQLALSLPNRVYVEWSNSDSTQWKNPESTVLCEDYICSAKFVGCQGNLFVVALNNGDLKLCDFKSSAVHHIFRGHRDTVNCIAVFCPEIFYQQQRNGHIHSRTQDHIMASASNDGTCKLWDLTPFLQKFEASSESSITEDYQDSSPSPKLRPHNKSWTFDSPTDDSYLSFEFHTAPVTFVEFSYDGSQVVSTSKNELLGWSPTNGAIIFKFSLVELNSCHFPTSHSDFILGTTDTEIVVISSQRPTVYNKINAHFLKIVALLFRSKDSFCTVSENEISMWKIYKTPVTEKIQRLRISPRNSVPINNGSSVNAVLDSPQNLGGSLGNFLHPDDYVNSSQKSRSNRSSYGEIGGSFKLLSGRTSPTSKSDIIDSSSTHIELGNCVVHIMREQSISKDKGLFHSAALDSQYGDGDLLVCGTYDHKIVLLQLDKLLFLGEFSAHNGPITAVCFSPVDEFSLLSASADQTTKVWDVANEEKEETESKRTGVYSSLPFEDPLFPSRPDFISLCATHRRTLQVYQASNLVEESQPISAGITAVALLRDGTQAAVGTEEGQIFWVSGINKYVGVVDPEKDKHDKKIESNIKFELIGNHEYTSKVISLQFGHYDNVLASGSSKDILIFKDFQPHWRITLNHESDLIGMHFCFRDSTLVICGENGYVGVKDIDKKSNLEGQKSIKGHNIKFTCTFINKESKKLAMGSEQGLIYLLDLKKNAGIESTEELQCKHSSYVRSVALSMDGEKLAVGHDNGLITIWNLSTAPYKEEQDLILHKSPVEQLRFSSRNFGDAPWLLSCGDQLALWSFEKAMEKLRTTFMQDKRRRRSGESRSCSRLSMEIPADVKVGRQGKRELLQTFLFYGNAARHVSCDSGFSRFVTVDDCGVFYILDII
ncbi:unnamed protein product [Allacma fusca]|uniref:CARD domain-containing protein n=1 Tax=Allacma fusca TaxID=39272 RepID=A0A8J2PK73_9HEXA|nr:unnamed protein product [Allacma fusca]